MMRRPILGPKSLVLSLLLLPLILVIACGGAASTAVPQMPSTTAPVADTAKVTQEARSAPAVPISGFATPTPEPARQEPAPTTNVVGSEPAPTAMAEPTQAPVPTMEIIFGGHIPMHDYASPTNRAAHEWGYSMTKNIAPLFNGLLEWNPETADPDDIRCDLCSSWEVGDDGMTYTFRLPENANWWDGAPVTAADIVFSLESATADPDTIGDLFGGIFKGQTRSSSILTDSYYESSRALDPKTVEVKTKFPAPGFLPSLAIATVVMIPRHTVLDEGKIQSILAPDDFNGSGPFTHLGYTKDVKNEYAKNENYFKDGYPRIDGMTHFIILDSGTIIASFKAGQVLMTNGLVNNLSNKEALQLKEEAGGELDVHFAGPAAAIGVVLNTTKKPLDDVRVRRAINLAIHRQAFIDTFSQGLDLLGTPFPPGAWFSYSEEEAAQMPGFRELDGKKHPEDLAEAKRLLEAAGYPDGFSIELATRNVLEYPDIVAVLKDQLNKSLGLDITLKLYESSAGYKEYDSGNVQMAVQGSSLSVMDPDAVFGRYNKGTFARWAAGGAQGNNFVVPGLGDLDVAQSKELDSEKRKDLVLQAHEILLNEDNVYPLLYWTMRTYAVSTKIQNFNVHPSIYAHLKHEHIWCDPACN